jgi:hypothetical protein
MERAAYLSAEQPHLNDHIARAPGWSIATDVIKCRCRYLVKDRPDITGARWSLSEGQAVLLPACRDRQRQTSATAVGKPFGCRRHGSA